MIDVLCVDPSVLQQKVKDLAAQLLDKPGRPLGPQSRRSFRSST